MKLALIVLALAACGVRHPVSPEASPRDRAVQVTTFCGDSYVTGSGVVTGPHEVLTAAHVIGRSPLAWCDAPRVKVGLDSGVTDAGALGADPFRDTGAVYLKGDTGAGHVERAAAVAGPACAYPTFPGPAELCGDLVPGGPEGRDLSMTFPVVPGNSGAGVWQNGRLVGLVTWSLGGASAATSVVE